MKSRLCLWMIVALSGGFGTAIAAPVVLGPFTFESSQFGDTLTQSDGGTHANSNWLNVVNANPGSPGFLTGPNFDTGIANIGLFQGPVAYTIGYNVPIANSAGVDLGVVVARFNAEPVLIEFSSDGGLTFSAQSVLAAIDAISSGVSMDYFYDANGPFPATLFVHALDLSDFGFGAGDTVNAIRIVGNDQLDLIRAAGLFQEDAVPVPEPGTITLVALGLLAASRHRRRTDC